MRGCPMRISALFPSIAMLAGLLSVAVQGPAVATSDSGRLDCSGRGNIVPRISYQPHYGYKVAVKRSGPPSSPTWGNSVPNNGAPPDSIAVDAYWSPYAAGTWSAYSRGPVMAASAACSQRPAPTGRPVRVVSLGAKSCSTGRVAIDADGFANIWISWRKTASGPRHRAYFPKDPYGFIVLNRIYTRDPQVYDIRIHAYNSNAERPLQGYGAICSTRGTGSVS